MRSFIIMILFAANAAVIQPDCAATPANPECKEFPPPTFPQPQKPTSN